MIKDYLSANFWVAQVFVVVFLVLLLNFVQKRILNRLHDRLSRTSKVWDDAVVDALRRPLTLLIWIAGLALAAKFVQQETEAVIFQAIDPIRDVGVIACITWFLMRLTRRIESNVVEKNRSIGKDLDITTVDAIAKLVRLSFFITAALVILQTLGFSISGVLAFGGIGGIAVGFAAKDLLANFFGGLMIYLDRPFVVGDWVRSPDREIEGTVEEIGWRLTVIRTFDKRPLYVPNATFANIAVENPSRMTNRRIYETIGIRYEDMSKMAGIVADVRAMLESHADIDPQKTLIVNFNSFAPSSLDFFVYTFTRTTDWIRFHEVKQDVLIRISDIIQRHGAEVAFPTSTVHVRGYEHEPREN
ncbi:MAG: mechanosensitive ion channel family protein [Gammaproteobacteria bacterium]|nr:mechanosensitive ion channel family protein [Gammaproteobacteria bacterium]